MRSPSHTLVCAMLPCGLSTLQLLGAAPNQPRGARHSPPLLQTPSLTGRRRAASPLLDLELHPRVSLHPRRSGCCCASSSDGERSQELPGAAAPGWVQQQQAADRVACTPSVAGPAPRPAGGEDTAFRLDSTMSLEDDMHVFGYEPQPGEQAPFGPPVLLVAGMRAEEVPRVRELLDELGGHGVKLLAVCALPCALCHPVLLLCA